MKKKKDKVKSIKYKLTRNFKKRTLLNERKKKHEHRSINKRQECKITRMNVKYLSYTLLCVLFPRRECKALKGFVNNL